MLIVGLPYALAGQTTATGIIGGAPYGAGTIAGADGSRSPGATDLAGARFPKTGRCLVHNQVF